MKNSIAQKMMALSPVILCIAPVFIIPALVVHPNYMLGLVIAVGISYILGEVAEMMEEPS